jgi:hypothetical protein
MRGALLAGIALCSAALLGLTPVRALATNPPLDRASVAPAPEKNASAAPDASVRKAASVGKNASPRSEASPQSETSVRQGSARQERPGSDQPRRAVSRPPGQRQPVARALDLSAPPISHVMTPEQVQALIGEPEDSAPEDVMVEEERYQAPVPRGQIQALTWALVHPLEAWRIFTPVTDQ